jgi:histidinol phosphatase-like enzyme (inositol monophosphatase family)
MLRTDDPLIARLDVAARIAHEAGKQTLDSFQRSDLLVERKSDQSPVTDADRQAELLLRARIAAAFPHDAILGEEFGEIPGTSGFLWALDPIDGTKSFIAGVPLYTTLVGVSLHGESVCGAVYAPASDELVYAAKGQGAWYVRQSGSPRKVSVSGVETLADSLFVTTDVRNYRAMRQVDATPIYCRLQDAARLTRTWGDAFGYLLVATGRAEVMIDPAMHLWDTVAVKTIVEEAGGTFTDWQGRARIDAGEGLATNGHVLAEVLAQMRG